MILQKYVDHDAGKKLKTLHTCQVETWVLRNVLLKPVVTHTSYLVGGLEHVFFPYIGNHNPN